MAAFVAKVAEALPNLKQGQVPSAADLQKLQGLQADATKVAAAGQHISTWVQQNCHA